MSETEEEAQRREWLESRVKELEQQNKLLEDNLARTESSAAAAAVDAARRGVSSNSADEEGRTRRVRDSAADGGGAAASVYDGVLLESCLLYTSPSPRDATLSRMPSSA